MSHFQPENEPELYILIYIKSNRYESLIGGGACNETLYILTVYLHTRTLQCNIVMFYGRVH